MRKWLLALLVLGACKSEPSTSAETATKAVSPDQHEAKEKPLRIVSIGGVITETLFALGRGEAVVGVDSSSTYPSEASNLEHVGSHHQVSVEGIMSLRPTHIIATSGTPPKVIAQLESTGMAITRIEEATSLAAVSTRIIAIGDAVGMGDASRALAQSVSSAIADATASPTAQAAKVLFVYARGSRVLSVAGTDTAADAIITAAGFKNAAADLSGFAPLNSEAVVAAAPDVLLMMNSGAKSLASQGGAFTLPGISLTPAGKAKRLVEMDGLFLLGLGPRTADAITALQAAVNQAMSAQ